MHPVTVTQQAIYLFLYLFAFFFSPPRNRFHLKVLPWQHIIYPSGSSFISIWSYHRGSKTVIALDCHRDMDFNHEKGGGGVEGLGGVGACDECTIKVPTRSLTFHTLQIMHIWLTHLIMHFDNQSSHLAHIRNTEIFKTFLQCIINCHQKSQ